MLPDYQSAERLDFFCTGLCTFCHNVQNELRQLKRAHAIVQSTWEAEFSKIRQKMEEAISNTVDEEQKSEIGQDFSYDFAEVHEYEMVHRHSILLTVQNSLEHFLDELCKVVTYTMNSKIKHTDLKDHGINRALSFLTKVAGFDLSEVQTERQTIKETQQIRNLIVHAGAKLPDDPNHKTVRLVTKSSYFNGAPSGYINIEPTYIEFYIDTLISFFNKLSIQVESFQGRVVLSNS